MPPRRRMQSPTLQAEPLEQRCLLSASFPAYVNGTLGFGSPSQDAPYGVENTFLLASRPMASKTIYLDFDGHHSADNGWSHDVQFPAFDLDGNPDDFSDAELVEIQLQFQNVAEDYLPFDVNVTTRDPGVAALTRNGGSDSTWGIRAVNTQSVAGDGFENIGGIAQLSSFSSFRDAPAFIFNKGPKKGANTNSHEIGHSLGLHHQGLFSEEYHPGVGTGATSWGPLMGAPDTARLTQWSDSSYSGSTIDQDDLFVITALNGFGYRDDDHGDSAESAVPLSSDQIVPNISHWGIIEQNTDVDVFSFSATAEPISIFVKPFDGHPNLDILATLSDSSGNVVATSDPRNRTDAVFNNLSLTPGTFTLAVEGTGNSEDYSDYGSLGFYSINADGIDAPPPALPPASIEIETQTNGFDADDPQSPEVPRVNLTTDTVRWTYQVSNDGQTPLQSIEVQDNMLGPLSAEFIVSKSINADAILDVGEVWTYAVTGAASLGLYANLGSVVGSNSLGEQVSASDPSHYIGIQPAIDIEVFTNGAQADNADDVDVPQLEVGTNVAWTYVVTNTGENDLEFIEVTDSQLGIIANIAQQGNGDAILEPGEIWTFEAMGTTVLSIYLTVGTVVATGPNSLVVSDTDRSHYLGINPATWHNAANPVDVNKDGSVAPNDAIIVINELTNRDVSHPTLGTLPTPEVPSTFYYDVNDDNFVSPTDAVMVINAIPNAGAAQRSTSSESSASANALAPAPIVPPVRVLFVPQRGEASGSPRMGFVPAIIDLLMIEADDQPR